LKLEKLVPEHEHAILLISDQAYLTPARFVSAQLLKQELTTFDVVVLAKECTRESKGVFDRRVKVVDIEPDPALGSLPASGRRSNATYLRLSSIDCFRGKYRKLLYLDCDVWIGDRPIGRLLDLDMGDYEVAAVRDAAEIVRPLSAQWAEYRANLGLPKCAAYFNTGVMLLDVERFCGSRVGSNAIAYLAAGRYVEHDDQSALNAILAGGWLEISPLWNWMFGTRVRLTAKYDPAVIHFIGSNKPWKDRKAKHHPKYRMEMENYLTAFSEQAYVEPVPLSQQWRRFAVNGLKETKTSLVGDQRDNRIERFMATTKFADVEAGIVARSW
jgi:lipopolysaccharide biosynthesis glycosyltransferase